MKKVLHYLDKLEDRIRGRLSRYPIIYSVIGGVFIVVFWRGVWTTADLIATSLPQELIWIDGPLSVCVSVLILLGTGLFVSFFINDQIILSGLNKEKKIAEKTEAEVRAEATMVDKIQSEMVVIEKEIREIHDSLPIHNNNI